LTFNKGDYIYTDSETANEIYFVAEGRVKIFQPEPENREIVKAILSTGEIFGELALADEKTRTDVAQAMDNHTIVCKLSLEGIKKLMLDNKELSFSILKLVGFRLNKLERKIELLVFKDVRTRVVEFLKDAAEWKGKKVGTETLIITPLTHKEIGKLLGLSRQSVTGMLNELKKENLIYFDRRRILIRDITKLK
ncbi:MAG: Crp/Fnr family transcriptional regulator, partial [Bacteroidota bacterium]